jgi:hypothetical protein
MLKPLNFTEYPGSISWLIKTIQEIGFSIDVAEPCNCIGNCIVLLSYRVAEVDCCLKVAKSLYGHHKGSSVVSPAKDPHFAGECF